MDAEAIRRAREILANKQLYKHAFITAARTGWPEALDEVERLQRGIQFFTVKDAELQKLRAVAEAAEELCEVVKPGELGNYQDDFRDWLVKELKAWRESK